MSSEAYFAFEVLHRSIATDEVVPVIVFGDRVLPSRQISSRMFYAVTCFLIFDKTFAVDSPTRMMIAFDVNVQISFISLVVIFSLSLSPLASPPSPPTSPPSATSSAIVLRPALLLASRLFSSLTAHLPVVIVAPRNLFDLYLRCHQSLIRDVAVKIQRLRFGMYPKMWSGGNLFRRTM